MQHNDIEQINEDSLQIISDVASEAPSYVTEEYSVEDSYYIEDPTYNSEQVSQIIESITPQIYKRTGQIQ